MRTISLVESKPQTLSLTAVQAGQLSSLGRSLASDSTWWGETSDTERPIPSVVQCERVAENDYKVTVNDAIGAIGLGDVQLAVKPKVPLGHLVYLLEIADCIPRGSADRAYLEEEKAFTELVMRWFIVALEKLLRLGLDRDYERTIGDLTFARGRINALATSRSLFAGRPIIRCEFDTFDVDTSLNRVLRAAVLHTMSSPAMSDDLRRRARSVCQRLSGAGPLRPRDRSVMPDARTKHYRDAHQLALMVLSGSGMFLQQGAASLWTFLYRTPEPVEEGIRATLRRHLGHTWHITKKGKKLLGSKGRLLQPDLVFGDDFAVGDVKYQVTGGEISRPNLNQVTTFATGYGVRKAVVVAFGHIPLGEYVQVGDVAVSGINWDTSVNDPTQSGVDLARRVASWLQV
jgi:hypothetical protein